MSIAPTSFPSTVLLVDDEDVVLDLLSRVFKKVGLQHVAVGTGREAIALLEKQPFGCLISDKNLPDVNGLEVLRTARRLQPFCACIMITGYQTPESILEVLRMGASDYLEKPFPDMKLLIQRIESAMGHQRAEFERNTLVEALKSMQASLAEKSAEAFRQTTERQMLETVLELRVEEATAQLRARVDALEAAARSDREIDRALVQNLESLQEYVHGVPVEDVSSASIVRGILREIERKVDESVSLMRGNLEPDSGGE